MSDKIIQLAQKYKIYGWPLVSILISLAVAFAIIFPQIFGFFKTRQQIADLNSRTQNLDSKIKNLSSIDVKDYQDNLNVAEAFLPAEKDLPSVIGQIQSLLSISQLDLQDISFLGGVDSPKNPGVQGFQVKLDVTGSSQNFEDFINAIKVAPIIMKIVGIDISSNKGGVESINLTIQSYYFTPPVSVGSVEAPVVGLTPQEVSLLSNLQQNVPYSVINKSSGALPPRGKSNPFQ